MDGRAAAEEHKAAVRQAAAKQALRNGEISPESSSSFSSASAVPTENDDDDNDGDDGVVRKRVIYLVLFKCLEKVGPMEGLKDGRKKAIHRYSCASTLCFVLYSLFSLVLVVVVVVVVILIVVIIIIIITI